MDEELPEVRPQPERFLSGLQKAAIVMIALGPLESAAILKHVPEEETEKLSKTIAKLERVTPDEVSATLEEFAQFCVSQHLYIKGGVDYATKLLIDAYGEETAKRLIDRLMKAISSDAVTFENFRKADPQQLAKFIQDEHPQTIALILAHLDVSQAASLISSLPVETRTDVAMRMADLDQISPEIVRNIASVIDQKLRNLGELSRESYGGVRAVANIFNRLDPNTCTQLLETVERDNPSLFENIRRYMFVFRDLEALDPNALKAIMAKVERSVMVLALKGANESLRQKFFATQSTRGADLLKDDIESLGPVKLKDVDAAQQKMITIARELEKDGVISLKNSPNDQYVY
jgi:flagellar motor switch protein FliG